MVLLLSLFRNSRRERIAATAEATSGSWLICFLKYSTSSGDKQDHRIVEQDAQQHMAVQVD